MKRILLVGASDSTTSQIGEFLTEKYQVQICVLQMDFITSMANIFKPDMIVVLEKKDEGLSVDFVQWIFKELSHLPILLIAADERWNKWATAYESVQLQILQFPIEKGVLLENCRQLLSNGSEDEKRKILVIDDNPTVLRTIKGLLDQSYEVALSTSGEKGLIAMSKNLPDLVLLDYEMPGMNGRQVFEIMLEDEILKTIPVVFLTGVSEKQQIVDVIKLNPAGYILKPPDIKLLLETIEEVLD